MKLSSPAFQNGAPIPSKYTCDGKNVNPEFQISEVPEDAKSLAFVMDDPDSPSGTFVHWTLWDMHPKTPEILVDSVPLATEGMTSFGKPGYGGPCPQSGEHRYFFKLYALDTALNLPSSTDVKTLMQSMQGHILSQVELMGRYARGKKS